MQSIYISLTKSMQAKLLNFTTEIKYYPRDLVNYERLGKMLLKCYYYIPVWIELISMHNNAQLSLN